MSKSQQELEQLAQQFLQRGQIPTRAEQQPASLEEFAQQFLQQQQPGLAERVLTYDVGQAVAESPVGRTLAPIGVGVEELAKGLGRGAATFTEGVVTGTPEERGAVIGGAMFGAGRALAETGAAALDILGGAERRLFPQAPTLPGEELPGFFTALASGAHELEERANDALTELVTTGKLTEQKARDLNMLSGVVGYALPGLGSYKLAGTLARIRGLSALGAPVAKEAAAGAIFGTVFTPGDAEARAESAALNASLGMVFGTIFNPTRSTIGFYRGIRRAANAEGARGLRVLQEIQDTATGARIPRVKEDQAEALMGQLNQEYYIMQSPRAMEILQRTGDYRASVAALSERGQSGVIRGVGDLPSLLPRLVEEFSNLKFNTRVVNGTQGDIFFGPKGLRPGSTAATEFSRTGRIPGQRVMLGSDTKEYSYVKSLAGGTRTRVKDSRGKEHTFRTDRLKFLDEVEVDLSEHADDALVDDFIDFWKQQQDTAAEQRSVPAQPVAARRAFPNHEGAVIDPEELGIPVEMLVQGAEDAAALPAYPNHTFMETVRDWARERELLKRVQERTPEGRFAKAKQIEPSDLDAIATRASLKIEAEGRGLLDTDELAAFDTLDDALTRAAETDALNLSFLGPASRHSVRRLGEGQIYARHMDTGAAILFENEQAAINGFLSMRGLPRRFDDGLGSPSFMSRGGGVSGGAPIDDVPFELFEPLRIFDPDNLPTEPIKKGLTSRAWRVLMVKPKMNIVDWSARAESVTKGKIPIWSQGIRKIDEGITRYNTRIFPEAATQYKIFGNLDGPEAQRLGDGFFEAKGLDADGTRSKMAEMGIGTEGQKAAFLARRYDERKIVPILRNELGIEIDSWLDFHYRVLQPTAEHFGVLEEAALRANYTAEFGRDMPDNLWKFIDDNRGMIAQKSKDPRHVVAKVMVQAVNAVEVRPTERALAALATRENPLGILELDPEQQAVVIQAVGGIEQLRNMASVLSGALEAVRGQSAGLSDASAGYIVSIMRMLGRDPDVRLIRSITSSMMSNVYGATMGLRPAIILRDWWQNYWNVGTRIGFGPAGEGMERALDPEVINKWRIAGAFDPEATPLPGAEEFMNPDFVGLLPDEIITGETHGISGAIKRFAAKASVKTARRNRKLLAGYTTQDQFLRTAAAEAQYIHADRRLRRFEAGNITEKQLLKQGLPFFEQSKKDQFMRLVRAGQREDALLFIGKEMAHESNFIYRRYAQAPWLQNPYVRGAMQFVTWPMWQSEMYLRRMWQGTWDQQLTFLARNAAAIGALKLLAHQTGTDTSRWISPLQWFDYSGGPQLDIAIDAKEFFDAPADRKVSAFERMVTGIGRVQVPAMGLVRDVTRVAENAQSPEHAFFMAAIGFPQELPGNYWMDIAVDPSRGAGTPLTVENITRQRAEAKAKRIEAFVTPVRPLPPQALPGLTPPPPAAVRLPEVVPGFSTGDAFLDRTFGIAPLTPSAAQLPTPVGQPPSGLSSPVALPPAPAVSPSQPPRLGGGFAPLAR